MTEKPEMSGKNITIIKNAHQRQQIWQIFLPFVFVLLIAAIFVILAIFAGTEEVSVWSAISLMFLLIPSMIVSLLVLFFLGVGVYGLGRVMKIIPKYTCQVQQKIKQIETEVRKVSNGVVKPFISIRSQAAGLNVLLSLTSKKKRDQKIKHKNKGGDSVSLFDN
jgi:predicted PurR-regulated permease PerM